MSEPDHVARVEPEQCSSTGSLAEDATIQLTKTEAGGKPRKIRGKWVRSNVSIGDLRIREANELARSLTGEQNLDLRLPEWSQICKDWKKFNWMRAEDVVYNRILCLLCQHNVLEPTFTLHMKKVHPDEGKDVVEVLKRMTTVRLSRFFCRGVVDHEEIEATFPEAIRPAVEEILKVGGCIVRKLRESERERMSTEVGRIRKRKSIRPNDLIDLTKKREEAFIKGIAVSDAQDMADVLTEEGGALSEVLFGDEIVPGLRGDRISIHLRRDYCYSCQLNVPSREFERHFTVGSFGYHQKFNPTPDGSFEVMSRMTEVRMCRFFSANPIPAWKVDEVCNGDEQLMGKFRQFLLVRGFAINMFATDRTEEWPLPTCVNEVIAEEVDCDSERYEPPSEASSAQVSDDSPSVSYASSPASSRSSSRCSSPASDGVMNIPYSVMNRLRLDHRIEHALLDIETSMEIDDSFSPTSPQYMFIMGYAMFSLVVSNGCKLSVLNRLLLSDYSNAFKLKDSELALMKYRTTGQCQGRTVEQWLVIDACTRRAMDLYLLMRNRRAEHLDCPSMITYPESSFFISFYLKGMNGNDIDYPLSQFLRMCGVSWKFRARQFSATVDALLVRDSSKTNADYAYSFYNRLRALEKNQCEIIGSPENHPVILDMKVEVQKKTRKNKGVKRGPMGPNASTIDKLLKKMKRSAENDRLAKRVKKICKDCEDRESADSGGASGSEGDSEDSGSSMPVHSSPTRRYTATPPPSTPSAAYAKTPEPEEPHYSQCNYNFSDIKYL